jgi:hypothetical protein
MILREMDYAPQHHPRATLKTRISQRIGRTVGWTVAPLFGLASFARHARTFHPSGPIFHARVTRHLDVPPAYRSLAERLSGFALVRFSGALWKHADRLPDVLGCALRLTRAERETALPEPDDQDLLFATIRRPWTMPFAPLTTDVRDYLENDFFGVAPFDVGMSRRVYLRLHPIHPATAQAPTRSERIAHEVALGGAGLSLEVGSEPFGPWTPLLAIKLERPAHVDGEALRFEPFHAGRGVRPVGFIHALRRGVYSFSQGARPNRAA